MNKFSLIKENINLGRFSITDNEFKTYIREVDSIKNSMYPSEIEDVEGLKLLKALPFEKRHGRDYSVLNKVNTNRVLMSRFVQNYNLGSFNDLLNFIKTNKDQIFNQDGSIFKLVWETIRQTEKVGEENEELVSKYIKALAQSVYKEDIDVKREVTSSYNDLILGIDITFTLKGKNYTCQVKPLKNVSYTEKDMIVTSSGRIKKYKTDYIAFSNAKTNEVLLFRAKNVRVSGDNFIFPKNDFVSTPDSIFDILNKF
jgi:hypothetical protein